MLRAVLAYQLQHPALAWRLALHLDCCAPDSSVLERVDRVHVDEDFVEDVGKDLLGRREGAHRIVLDVSRLGQPA